MTIGELVKDAIDSRILRFDSELFVRCLSGNFDESTVIVGISGFDEDELSLETELVPFETIEAYHQARFDGFREIVREALEDLVGTARYGSLNSERLLHCWQTIFPGEEPRVV